MAGAHSSSRIVADRYVSALCDVADGNMAMLEGFERFLSALETLLASNQTLEEAIANPTTPRKAKTAVMETVATQLKATKEQQNFLALLAKNNRLDALSTIIACFRERLSALRGEVVLEITTARPMDKAALSGIKSALDSHTGKNTVLKTREDPSILGGVVIKYGSSLLDYSVEGKLSRLELSLKQHIANA